MALEGSWHVPGAGPIKKPYVLLGIAGVGVAIYWTKRKGSSSASSPAAAASSAAAAGSDPYPPDGTTGNPQDPYSTDPATGQTYGDEALASGNFAASVGGGGASGGGSSDGSSSGPPFASNQAWQAFVSNYMISTEGRNPTTVGEDLGAYLTGAPIASSEVPLIRDAIGIGGPPPVPGAGGFPPSINVSGSQGGGGSGSLAAPGGLKSSGVTRTHAELSWRAVSQASGYEVHYWEGGKHSSTTTTGTKVGVGNLKAHTRYSWQVRATDSAGPGAWSPVVSFHTK